MRSVLDGEGLEVEEGIDWERRDRETQKCHLSLVTASLSHACSPFVSGKMHLIPLIQGSECNRFPCELISMFHIHFLWCTN